MQTEGLNVLLAARAPNPERPLTLKLKFLFALRRHCRRGEAGAAKSREAGRYEEVMPMIDAVGSQANFSWGLCRPAEQKTSGAARRNLTQRGENEAECG